MKTRRKFLQGVCAAVMPTYAGETLSRAHPADRFVDSVGLCTHLESPPYNQDLEAVAKTLASLGVRHLRDEVRPSNEAGRWRALVAECRVRFQLLISPVTNTIPEMLSFIQALGPTAIAAVEGQNEGDSPWFTAQERARPDWAEVVVRYQREAFAALRGNQETRGIPLVSPSVLDYRPDDMRRLLGAASFSDLVAVHAYLQGQQHPETTDDYASIDWYLRTMRDPFKPAAPVMVTETGYATGMAGISESAAAIYLPRLLLHLFDRGVERSFIYELMDEGRAAADPEQSYGIVTVTAQPKPAFHTLKLLLQTLADPGPPFVAAPFPVIIERAPPDFRQLSFRKRDGSVILALWRAAPAWDPRLKRDITVEPRTVRLRLPPCSEVSMRTLSPDTSETILTVQAQRVDLPIGGMVALAHLTP